ncbi:MAG TPA: hypothetical protein VFC53_12155 [Dehalococcoidia bacterium]|nr:hypothetical protein [Dehalococcoidia bacterium]
MLKYALMGSGLGWSADRTLSAFGIGFINTDPVRDSFAEPFEDWKESDGLIWVDKSINWSRVTLMSTSCSGLVSEDGRSPTSLWCPADTTTACEPSNPMVAGSNPAGGASS